MFTQSDLISRFRLGQAVLNCDIESYESIIIPFHKSSLLGPVEGLVDDWAFIFIVRSSMCAYCVDGKSDGTDRTGLSEVDRNVLSVWLTKWFSDNNVLPPNGQLRVCCLGPTGLLEYDRILSPYDSGIFIIVAINFIIRSCPITFTTSNMNKFRLHVAHQLLQCEGRLIFD